MLRVRWRIIYFIGTIPGQFDIFTILLNLSRWSVIGTALMVPGALISLPTNFKPLWFPLGWLEPFTLHDFAYGT